MRVLYKSSGVLYYRGIILSKSLDFILYVPLQVAAAVYSSKYLRKPRVIINNYDSIQSRGLPLRYKILQDQGELVKQSVPKISSNEYNPLKVAIILLRVKYEGKIVQSKKQLESSSVPLIIFNLKSYFSCYRVLRLVRMFCNIWEVSLLIG